MSDVNVLSNTLVTDNVEVNELFDLMKAPKITNEAVLNDIRDERSSVTFVHINRTIVCHVSLLGKFDVVGSAAVMSSENHHEKVGKYYALERVIDQIAEMKAYAYLIK